MDYPVRPWAPGAGYHAGSPASLMSGTALVRLLERARNVEEVEELLLAAAVHSEGAGFARARLMRIDPATQRLLEVRRAAERCPP